MDNCLVAITGGIGSGKSCALEIFESLGEKVVSCDEITNEVYLIPHVIKTLGKVFPTAKKGFFKKRLDKKEIARIVFNDKQKLEWLTQELTPLILKKCLHRANLLGGRVFIEVPLLFECSAQKEFDKVIVITRDKEERIQSVMSRSNLTREKVLARIDAQFDYDNADLSEYTVISNDGNVNNLKEKLVDYIKQM